jgi:NAD(P)-dependent dehydrogenase (short-subunit alcohol dehydrogenase family)
MATASNPAAAPRRSSQILEGKHAVVFGAGGSVGAAVAKEFAAEGAEVFLAGRTKANVDDVAKHIAAAGGRVQPSVINALDDAAVNDYIDDIVARTGAVDIVFNAVGPLVKEYGNGTHAVDLTIDEFMVPLTTVREVAVHHGARGGAPHGETACRRHYFPDRQPGAGSCARRDSHWRGVRRD